MTAETLIQVLQKACEDEGLDPSEVEVRLAMHPSWPMEYSIDQDADIGVIEIEEQKQQKKVVYLPEGSRVGYLPGVVSVYLGWRKAVS